MGWIPTAITRVILLIAGIIAFSLFIPGGLPLREDRNISALTQVEVRDYEGARLSSIADFRENSIRGPQYLSPATYRLEISGLVRNPRSLSYDEILTSVPQYEKKVTLFCVEGWDVTILWEGVRVKDLLADAGIAPGANMVIFSAADGYSTSLPLDYILERDILLAHTMNRVRLPAERGFPLQLVAEDQWGYTWITWVTRIQVSDDPSYQGYWEQRGFSQSGEVRKRW